MHLCTHLPTTMNERTLAWASGTLLLAVALGAFGAHGVQGRVDAQSYHVWNTASRFQFYHGLALLGLAAFEARFAPRTVGYVRTLFLLGMLCFCGSLYLLATRDILGTAALTRVLGPITPLGGLLFLAGWAVLLVAAIRRK
jgi:uncharacterized membrane protein YgdD (TMEM256/DUF423 family)